MKKIPTLFVRDPDDPKHVTDQVTPGCEWVLNGEGVATRKYDGVCLRLTPDGQWWARREVKAGKQPPPAFVAEGDYHDGGLIGWEPIEQTGWTKMLREAEIGDEAPGTYELCGPKVNGNPEGLDIHALYPHGAHWIWRTVDREMIHDADRVRNATAALAPWEGVVWWRHPNDPDCDKAKLKVRDVR